jgi:hypothetical protein
MKQNVLAAAILAVGLVLAAFLFAGRYYVLKVDSDTVVSVDRWTGKTKIIEVESQGEAADIRAATADAENAANNALDAITRPR